MKLLRFRTDPSALTIRQALEAYFNDRARTRSASSVNQLRTTISLFIGFLHSYGYTSLKAGPERDAYQAAWESEHLYFEEFGGPELLDRLFIQYMGYYIAWECPVPAKMTREARAFVRDAASWLRDQGYLTSDAASRVRSHAVRTTAKILAGQAITKQINDAVVNLDDYKADRDRSAEIEGGFTIVRAADGIVEATFEGTRYFIHLPPMLVELLAPLTGAVFTGRLLPDPGRSGHRLAMMGKILPHPTEEEVPMLEEQRRG